MKAYLRLRLLTLLLCISTVGALAQVRPVFEERFDDLSAGIPSGWNNDRTTGDVRSGATIVMVKTGQDVCIIATW